MAELVDALVSGTSDRKVVQVRVPVPGTLENKKQLIKDQLLFINYLICTTQ